MTSLTGTPYGQTETGAVYDQAAALLNDEFDTSGTSKSFCSSCEHDPCVAEYRRPSGAGRCGLTPRVLNVERVRWPIVDAGNRLEGRASKVYEAMRPAIYALASEAAVGSDTGRRFALTYLVEIRDNMRKLVAS